MYWKVLLGFLFLFQLITQFAAAAVIEVYPEGPGRHNRSEAPVESLTPELVWAPAHGVDTYEIDVMKIDAGGLHLAYNQKGIVGAERYKGWLSYNLPAGVLAPNNLYFWAIKPSKPELQAANAQALYFRTGPENPSPGSAVSPGPIVQTLTPRLEWPVWSGSSHYVIGVFDVTRCNPDVTKGSYDNPAVLRTETFEPVLNIAPGMLKPGKLYDWTVATNAREGSRSFVYYFRTEAEAFRTGLSNEVSLPVGNGIGFKVMGGYKPYTIEAVDLDIAWAFRQGNNECGEDFQINAKRPGTTYVWVFDSSTPRKTNRIKVVVTPK